MKVRRLDRRDKGYTRIEWLLDYYEVPKRIRKWYPLKAQAEGAMNELKQQHRETGQNWLVLSPEEWKGLMRIHAEAQAAGITLRTVWEAYKSGKLDAATPQRRTLAQPISETTEAKAARRISANATQATWKRISPALHRAGPRCSLIRSAWPRSSNDSPNVARP